MKKFFVLLCGLMMAENEVHAFDIADGILALFSVATPYAVDIVNNTEFGGTVEKKAATVKQAAGINSRNFIQAIAISEGLLAAGLIYSGDAYSKISVVASGNDDQKKTETIEWISHDTLKNSAKYISVLAVGLSGLEQIEIFQKLINNTPLRCTLPNCTGACSGCIPTKRVCASLLACSAIEILEYVVNRPK